LRIANKTEYVDGVLVPKGTVITIPVRPFRIQRLISVSSCFHFQIRVINTWKDVWGDDAEECVFISPYFMSSPD
jgi:hypothetical protein